jgi:hypothetical protein
VEAAAVANAAWLEDVVGHLLAVLALDRFADYVSDQVRRNQHLSVKPHHMQLQGAAEAIQW